MIILSVDDIDIRVHLNKAIPLCGFATPIGNDVAKSLFRDIRTLILHFHGYNSAIEQPSIKTDLELKDRQMVMDALLFLHLGRISTAVLDEPHIKCNPGFRVVHGDLSSLEKWFRRIQNSIITSLC